MQLDIVRDFCINMNVVDLKNWEDFERHIEKLLRDRVERKSRTGKYISEYLFRGQSDSQWSLTTTLERNVKPEMTLEEYYRIVCVTKPQVETFTGVTWEIPSLSEYTRHLTEDGRFLPEKFLAYEYFVYLRHHGFPSPLLDWTRSAYVAAYFAFRDVCSTACNVSIYAYCEYTEGHKTGSTSSPEIVGLGPYVRSHRRHFQQQSQYTVCTVSEGNILSYASHDKAFAKNVQAQDELWKFNIPASERRKVLSRLELYNINAFSLFGSEESLMETVSLREIYLRNDTRS